MTHCFGVSSSWFPGTITFISVKTENYGRKHFRENSTVSRKQKVGRDSQGKWAEGEREVWRGREKENGWLPVLVKMSTVSLSSTRLYPL